MMLEILYDSSPKISKLDGMNLWELKGLKEINK